MKKVNIFEQESYKNDKKDWRDAFVEKGIIKKEQKVRYSSANCVKINEVSSCIKYTSLIAYVSQFDGGGFWFNKNVGLHFVTNGYNSDKDATYEDAEIFLELWDKKHEKTT